MSILLFIVFLPRFEKTVEPVSEYAVLLLRLRHKFVCQQFLQRLRRKMPLEHAADGNGTSEVSDAVVVIVSEDSPTM